MSDYDVWVDFNDIVDGLIVTLVEYAKRPVKFGQNVRAGDEEGNRCYARVIGEDERFITLDLDLTTFEPAE